MATTTSITAFILARLTLVSGIPAIASEGVTYTKKLGTPWVRMKMLPNETINDSIGVNFVQTLSGLAQFDIFYSRNPAPDVAITSCRTVAEAIVTSFLPATHVDGSDQIIFDNVWVEASREETAWIQMPVMVRYHAFRL